MSDLSVHCETVNWSSFISAGQLFQPHRRTSGGFRVGGGVNAAGAMLTFCWDKIFKKIHLKQYPPNAAGAMLKFCWDKIKIKLHLKQYPPSAAGAMLKFCLDKIK